MPVSRVHLLLGYGIVEVNTPLNGALQILAERDMLGTQLLKRNQELSLLYEKVRIQESTLAKGEVQYKVSWRACTGRSTASRLPPCIDLLFLALYATGI